MPVRRRARLARRPGEARAAPLHPAGARRAASASPGAGGWFELRHAPRGLLVLVVQHPDYLPEFVPVNTREPLPTVLLHRGGARRRRRPRRDGRRRSRAPASSRSPEQANDGAEVHADVRGRFALERLRPGPLPRRRALVFGRRGRRGRGGGRRTARSAEVGRSRLEIELGGAATQLAHAMQLGARGDGRRRRDADALRGCAPGAGAAASSARRPPDATSATSSAVRDAPARRVAACGAGRDSAARPPRAARTSATAVGLHARPAHVLLRSPSGSRTGAAARAGASTTRAPARRRNTSPYSERVGPLAERALVVADRAPGSGPGGHHDPAVRALDRRFHSLPGDITGDRSVKKSGRDHSGISRFGPCPAPARAPRARARARGVIVGRMPTVVNLDGDARPARRGEGLGLRPRLPVRRQRVRGHPHLRRPAVRGGGAPRAARATRPSGSASRRSGTRTRTAAEIARTLEAARGGDAPDPEAAPWNVGERYVRVVMTRGAGEIGLDPALAVDPVALVIVQPLAGPPRARLRRRASTAAIVGVRRAAPEAIDPSAKTGAHLPNVLAVREARAAGAHEALLLDGARLRHRGLLVERVRRARRARRDAAARRGHPRGRHARPRAAPRARRSACAAEEAPLRPEDLEGADEVFITSTVREIVPVTRLGARRRRRGSPGTRDAPAAPTPSAGVAGGPVGLAAPR